VEGTSKEGTRKIKKFKREEKMKEKELQQIGSHLRDVFLFPSEKEKTEMENSLPSLDREWGGKKLGKYAV